VDVEWTGTLRRSILAGFVVESERIGNSSGSTGVDRGARTSLALCGLFGDWEARGVRGVPRSIRSKGRPTGRVRVRVENGIAISWDELAWKSSAIQARFVLAGASVDGVGIYRLGPNRGIPAYYPWVQEVKDSMSH
jgi:hypothetical protein